MLGRAIFVTGFACALTGCSLVVDFDRTALHDAGADGSFDAAVGLSTNGSASGTGGAGAAGGAGGAAGSSDTR